MVFVMNISNLISEEKTAKITETLLLYTKSIEILLGKIIEIFLVIVLQVLIFTIVIIINNLIFDK